MNRVELLVRHARRIVGDERLALAPVDLDRSFEALGIDSLHLTEIAVAVLTELDVYVPMALLARATTPAAFLAVLEEEAPFDP